MSFFIHLPVARKLSVAFAAVIAIMTASNSIVYQKLRFVEQSAAATQVLSAAGELSQQSERLAGEVQSFVAGVRAA